MAADGERWGLLSQADGVVKRGAVRHERGGGDDPALMRFDDGAIDAARQAEVVGIHDEPGHRTDYCRTAELRNCRIEFRVARVESETENSVLGTSISGVGLVLLAESMLEPTDTAQRRRLGVVDAVLYRLDGAQECEDGLQVGVGHAAIEIGRASCRE